jgi:hypothetical protein
MFAETLSMIGRHREERLRPQSETLEGFVELTDECVRVCDLAIIREVTVPGRVGLRRFVRIVRFVQVEPEENSIRAARLFEPRDRCAKRLGTRPLQCTDDFSALGFRQLVVITVESAIESAASLEYER